MTAAQRTYLKEAVDAVRRQRITGSYITECLECGAPLPNDERAERRRFCNNVERRAWSARFGTFLPPSERTAPGRPKYVTDEERVAARRATWRKNRRNQYALYKTLTAQLGVPRNKRWGSHLAELRRQVAA